jgi:hypothetical protein
MTGFTDRTAQGILGHLVGKTTLFALPTSYLALFTAVGSDSGGGFTEVAGGAYARVGTAGTDWNAPSGSSPSLVTNANALTFPAPTANWGNIIAFGLYDALAVGNLLAWDFLGNYPWLPATVNAASPAVLTSKTHGYGVGDNVIWTLEYGGTNPAFAQSNFTGTLLVAAPVTADAFTVTNGGTAVNTTSTGDGMLRKLVSQNIPSGAQAPSFGAGALTITSA